MSLVTFTPSEICDVLLNDAGGDCTNESIGGGGGVAMMLVTATPGFEGVGAADDAVIVTTLPCGTLAGAVYTICPALGVCAGERLKLPQSLASHVAVQFTPTLPVLGLAVAVSVACEPVFRVAGGVLEMVMAIGCAVTTFTVAKADLAGSLVDVAVIVTVPPTSMDDVLLNVAAVALGV